MAGQPFPHLFHSLQWLSEHHGLQHHPQTSSLATSPDLISQKKRKHQALKFLKEIDKVTHHIHIFVLPSCEPPCLRLTSSLVPCILSSSISGNWHLNYGLSHLYLPSLPLYCRPPPTGIKGCPHFPCNPHSSALTSLSQINSWKELSTLASSISSFPLFNPM